MLSMLGRQACLQLLLAILVLQLAHIKGEIKDLKQPTETVYFSKSTEVVAMGCFTKAAGPEWDVFNQATKALDKYGGVNYGTTTTQAVWSRYLNQEDGAEAPPAIVVWSAFDPETGKIRKGKKSKVIYSGPWEYHSVYKFLLREGQPTVSRLPNREGPDFQKRQHLAMQSGFAKLFVFDNTGAGASDTLLTVAQEMRAEVLTIYYTVTTEDDDEGKAVLESFGLSSSDMSSGTAAAITIGSNLQKFSGDVADPQSLTKFVKDFISENEEPHFSPGEKAKGTKIPKKKKAKKSDL